MKRVFIQSAALCFLSMASQCAVRAENPAPLPVTTNSASSAAMAKKIYIDPLTGQRAAPPAGAVIPAATNRVSTSSEGLTEVPVTTKPGGFKVHLGGRFQATMTATNTANGKVAVRCSDEPAKIAH